MNKDKINHFLVNLNVVNIIIGYSFAVSIVMPLTGNVEGSSQLITIPYRAFSLLIAILVILFNIKRKTETSFIIMLFFVFWFAVLVRMFYDMEIRIDFSVLPVYKNRIWLLSIAGSFIPMLSLYKSSSTINYRYCFKLLYFGCVFILIPSFLFSLVGAASTQRARGNIALDPISFGAIGTTTAILAMYKDIMKVKINKLFDIKLVNWTVLLLGIYLSLRSGSRGPLFGLILIFSFWFSFRKGKLKGTMIFMSILSIVFILRTMFLRILEYFSPITAYRILKAIEGEDSSMNARKNTYKWFLDAISEYPLFGSQFAKLGNGHYPGYAHSIFLDILLGFGIVGLLVFMIIIVRAFNILIKNIKLKNDFWIGLIMMQYFLLAISSGAFYTNPILNCTIILTLLSSVNKTKLSK